MRQANRLSLRKEGPQCMPAYPTGKAGFGFGWTNDPDTSGCREATLLGCFLTVRSAKLGPLSRSWRWQQAGPMAEFEIIHLTLRLWARLDADSESTTMKLHTRPGSPLHHSNSKEFGTVGRIIAGSLFLIAGGVVLLVLGIWPWWQTREAREWVEIPARIISSEIRERRDSDGTQYSASIIYEYDFAGQSYRGERIRFLQSSSSSRKPARALVDAYPAGSTHSCFVNPLSPDRAVLDRDTGWLIWLAFPFGLLFLGLGAGLVLSPIARRGKSPSTESSFRPESLVQENLTGQVMSAGNSRRKSFLGLLATTVFWNGIVSVFLVQASTEGIWFLWLFLTPFIIIGLILVVITGFAGLGLLNPVPTLQLTDGPPSLGTPFRGEFSFRGSVNELQSLRILVEGAERATRRQGKSSVTEENIFYQQVVFSMDGKGLIPNRGEFRHTIPEEMVPTFTGSHNRIVWNIRLQGEITRRPKLSDSFPITVLPPS